MKKILILLTFTQFIFGANSWGKTLISVTAFHNKSAPQSCNFQWSWWNDHLGDAFKDMLISEILPTNKFELLEREHIKDIYNEEHELVNSASDQTLLKGQFKKAKFTVIGTVTEYEYCAEENKNKINVGSVLQAAFGFIPGASVVPDIQLANAKAKIRIILRVVDTTTGRIIQSIKTEGLVERSRINIRSDFLEMEQAKQSPIGEAAQIAIHKAVQQLNVSL